MKIHQKNMVKMILSVFFLIFAGCTPQKAVEVATAAPTPDTQSIAITADALRTQVAGTIVAGMTTTAESIPTETAAPTETQVPATELAVVDTATPPNTAVPATSTPVPTVVYVTTYPSWTSTPGPYQCAITDQAIKYGLQIMAGVDFDAKWTVKNIGTKTWTTGAVDYVYVSGTKMQTRKDSFDLATETAPGKSVTIIVDMVAPKEPGFYHAQWAMMYGDTVMCYLPVDIRSQ